MGKIPALTKEQKIILGEVSKNEFLKSNFYFTGGTALSAYYLNHRESEDIDFFSKTKFENQVVFTLMQEWSKKHQFKFDSRFNEVVYVFNLTFPDKAKLKVDFGYYPYRQLKDVKVEDDIRIDSLLDIAVNKLLTVQQRTNVKDFVDLFYLLDKFTVWDLMDGAKIKFGIKIEPLLIAADFMKVNQFENLPKMIKQLTLNELKSAFVSKAEKLGKKVVKA